MKKICVILLAFVCALFASCDIFKGYIPPSQGKMTTYYGVVETMEGNEGLFVNIPSVGLCDIPSYEKEQITVQEGDLLMMQFSSQDVVILERYPACISTPVHHMEVIDFSFSLTWGTYGISSYDSETGRLVKTSEAANVDAYKTTHHLTAQELVEIYKTIHDLDVSSYPDQYNPMGNQASTPNQSLILSVQTGVLQKTIEAKGIAYGEAVDWKGKKFIDACNKISTILTSTAAWKALPDYPILYD